MPPGWDYDSLRISSNLRMEDFKKSYSLGKENKVCIVVVLFLTISIVLYFLAYPNFSNSQKIVRTKRHVQTIDFPKYQNIEILSERRKNYHPNHRYEEEEEAESFKKMTDTLKNRRSWSAPQPGRQPNNIRDIILKGKFKGAKAEEQTRFLSDLLKGSGSTMRLKGVYLRQPGSEDGLFGSQSDDTFYDSEEINNLMRNDTNIAGKRPAKRRFKSPGAPFKLPVKGAEGFRRQSPNQRSKTRPITIYLDFYPMNFAKEASSEFKRREPEESSIASPSDTTFHNLSPIRPGNAGKFLLPQGNPNGIIMKLNLYPKESTTSEWKFDRRKPHSEYNKRAEKKSFGWFSKHEKKQKKKKKKDHPEKCTIVGLNPHGKRIRAKWKNKKGEWIHAEHVDVKYLKKEND